MSISDKEPIKIKSCFSRYSNVLAVAGICILISLQTVAQPLVVIQQTSEYKKEMLADDQKQLINLQQLIPTLRIDLRYATKENFTGEKLYTGPTVALMRVPAAKALMKVQQQLALQGFGLKIWDAYRPHRATRRMWTLIQDERYVSNPSKGSGHNRGLAIDVTLTDLKSGATLDMGTSFDHFSDTAHHGFMQLPAAVLKHRTILKQTMEQHGFKALETEWWHYAWPNDRNYQVLDLTFKEILRTNATTPLPPSLR